MLSRKTRSNKDQQLLISSNQELAKLERAGRKAKRQLAAMVNPVILRIDEAGVLRDQEGHVRNEQGQKLDADGNPIVQAPVLGDAPARVEEQPQAQVQAQAARGRTLGDYNRPDEFYANRSAIRLPAIQRADFELKPSYYQLVGQHPFHGLAHEHPMDHIERFEDLVTSMKHNGVSYDYLFCKLFPHSLGGEAAYWLKQLPTGCLTNWEDTKKAFLRNFYDDARSEDLRNNISQFAQRPTEAFKSAWVRFRAYQRDCPHHGFSEVQLLGIFFRGVDWRYQMALDSASNGNFNTRSPEDAAILIENLASSNSTKNADYERQKLAGSMDGKQIAELKTKLDSVHNILVNKKSVQFAAEVETFEPEEDCEEDVNYIGGSGFQGQRYGNQQNRGGYSGYGQRNNYSNNQNSPGYESKTQYQKPLQTTSSFTRNYGASFYQKPQASNEQSEIKALLEQVLEGQQKMTVDFNGKLDAVYADLNGKFESLNTHVKKLDVQVAQTAESIKRRDGVLPGSTDTNPKYQCSAITMKDGKEVVPKMGNGLRVADFAEFDEDDTSEVSVSIDTSLVSLDTNCDVLDENQPARVDRHQLCVARHNHSSDAEISAKEQNAENDKGSHKLSFSRPVESYDVLVEKIGRQVPWVHEFQDVPSVKKVLNSAHNSEMKFEDAANLVFVECAEILYNREQERSKEPADNPTPPVKHLPKLEDPGKFLIPCSISGFKFDDALADSGSTINLMSKDIADALRITNAKPSETTVRFANAQVAQPALAENVLVQIGHCSVPTDFYILNMCRGASMPLILGRSFLATTGAMIDLPNERLCLSKIDKNVFYDVRPESQGMFSSYIGNEKLLLDVDADAAPIREAEVLVTDTSSRNTSPSAKSDSKFRGEDILRDSSARKKGKPQSHSQPPRSKVTLTPLRRVGDTIEYKLKSTGGGKPFAKVRAIITPEAKGKGQAFIDDMLIKVLELDLHGPTASRPHLRTSHPTPNLSGKPQKKS